MAPTQVVSSGTIPGSSSAPRPSSRKHATKRPRTRSRTRFHRSCVSAIPRTYRKSHRSSLVCLKKGTRPNVLGILSAGRLKTRGKLIASSKQRAWQTNNRYPSDSLLSRLVLPSKSKSPTIPWIISIVLSQLNGKPPLVMNRRAKKSTHFSSSSTNFSSITSRITTVLPHRKHLDLHLNRNLTSRIR